MKGEFDKFSNLTVREITSADWEAYADYYMDLSDPAHYHGFLDDRDLENPQTWQTMLENTADRDDFVMFGLWDDDKMIGQTAITFLPKEDRTIALLAGSEIADGYRGRRLVDKLYQARMEYLQQNGFDGEIRTTIRPDNTRSKTAANRNGFIPTGIQDEHGYDIFVPES